MVGQLWQVGITEIFIGGSFVEDKDHPNDIDGYFVSDLRFLASGDLQRQLNLLDPHSVSERAQPETVPQSGRGTREPADPIARTRKSNFPCGISTVLNFTHTSASRAESVTHTGTSSSSPRRSGSQGVAASPKASFGSEAIHDPQ